MENIDFELLGQLLYALKGAFELGKLIIELRKKKKKDKD